MIAAIMVVALMRLDLDAVPRRGCWFITPEVIGGLAADASGGLAGAGAAAAGATAADVGATVGFSVADTGAALGVGGGVIPETTLGGVVGGADALAGAGLGMGVGATGDMGLAGSAADPFSMAGAAPIDPFAAGGGVQPVDPFNAGGTAATTPAAPTGVFDPAAEPILPTGTTPQAISGPLVQVPTPTTTPLAAPAAPVPSAATGAGGVISPTGATALSQETPGIVAGDVSSATATTPTTTLGSVAPAASDELQSELTAAGISPTGEGAYAAGTVQNALGPEVSSPGLFAKGGTLDEILSSPVTKIGAAILPMAVTALMGQPQVPQSISPLQASGSVTAPLISTETTQLNEANTGQLTPGEAAQIAQYQQGAEATLRSQLAAEGVTNPAQDSRYITGMATIAQNVQAMQQSYITNATNQGLEAAGEATGALTTAANAELQVDQEFQSALESAMSSFGLIFALQGLKVST